MSVIEPSERTITLGDMALIGNAPPLLAKALAVIADGLHPAFAAQPNLRPEISYRSCVLCSLTVRDFLNAVGFPAAHVATVACVLRAFRNERELHSLGIGVGDMLSLGEDWDGHLVVIEPGSRFLIDTTLYPAKRPHWEFLPGMIALPMAPQNERHQAHGLGREIVTGYELQDSDDPDYRFQIVWLDRFGDRSWRKGGDGRDRTRRAPVIRALVERFKHAEPRHG